MAVNWQQGWGFKWFSPSGGGINAPDVIVWKPTDPEPYVPGSTGSTPGTGGVGQGTQTPSPTNPTGLDNAGASAKAIIDGFLGQYGLQTLSAWAWQKWQSGATIDQIMLELRATPEYKQRFPAMEALAQKGHAMSEAQYINYETSAKQIMRAAGLPEGFYDQPDDFSKLLSNEVGLPELQSRIQAYQTLAYQSPPEVLDAWHNLYGLSSGELVATFIDPDRAQPLIEQRLAAAEAAGWSAKTGFGALSKDQAEALAKLGLTPDQFQAQFGKLATQRGLMDPLTGTTDQGVGQQTMLDAAFGANADAQRKLEEAKGARLSEFAGGGGGAATDRTGVVGAGSAR